MWNENAPLELLKDLPTVLNEANLARLQQVIDYDKFINSSECGYDLCGQYAPFCEGCDKTVQYPCAVSYVKMKQAEGMDIKIQSEVEEVLSEAPVETCECAEQPAEEACECTEQSCECQETCECEENCECQEAPAEEAVNEQPPKKLIRIAIARRRV